MNLLLAVVQPSFRQRACDGNGDFKGSSKTWILKSDTKWEAIRNKKKVAPVKYSCNSYCICHQIKDLSTHGT